MKTITITLDTGIKIYQNTIMRNDKKITRIELKPQTVKEKILEKISWII